MAERTLDPEAREAIRTYIYRSFFASGLVVALVVGTISFLLKDVLWQTASNKALETATDAIFQAQRQVSEAVAKADATVADTKLTANEVEDLSREVGKTLAEIKEKAVEANKILRDAEKTKRNIDTQWERLRKDEDFAKLIKEINTNRAEVVDEVVKRITPTLSGRVSGPMTAPNAYVLGYFKCSSNKHFVKVPGKETTTDHWLVFGINPNISSFTGTKASGDNALFSYKTSVVPAKDKQSWSVEYFVEVNSASAQHKKLRLTNCPQSVHDLQLVAIRAHPRLQHVYR